QLSVFPNSQGHVLPSRARSALLFAWASSQNSRVESERLQFWANEDLIAYLDFVEEVFIEPVSDGWAELIIAPLKDIWRRPAPEQSPLDARMRRWLKLLWKSHDLPSAPETTLEAHSLPTARTRAQLTLSFVALAILSERPIESFLPDLAIAWATESVSTHRHSLAKRPDGQI